MWCKRLEVENVGPHARLVVPLTRGLVGIFGPNGSGKSTLVDLIYASLTNDFGRFAGVKIDCVHNRAEEKAKSFVRTEWEHNGIEFAITRRLRGKPLNELVIDGKPITNEDKIKERLAELGVDTKTLNLFVFKRQDAIYDFMVSTDAERKKAFQALCQTELCEELHDLLGRALAQESDLTADIVDNSDELAVEIAAAEDRIEQARAEQTRWATQLLNAASEQSARQILVRVDRLAELVRQQAGIEAKLAEASKSLQAACDAQTASAARGRELKAQVEAAQPAADAARAALKSWADYARLAVQRINLDQEHQRLLEEAKKQQPPKKPEWFDGYDRGAEHTRIALLEDELDRARKTLKTFADTSVVMCPTCGTEVSHLHDHLEGLKGVVRDYPGHIEKAEQQMGAYDSFVLRQQKYDSWKAGHGHRLAANKTARENLAEMSAPEGDQDSLRKVVDDFAAATKRLDAERNEYRRLSSEVARLGADVASRRDRLAEIEAAVAEAQERPDLVEKARRRLDEHNAARAEIARFDGQIKEIQVSIDRMEADLKRLRERLKRSRKVRRMGAIMARAREVFHRNSLPNLVAQTNLVTMEADVNDGLADFGNPFWVEADDNLQFVVHKPGEPPQPAARLSTGQKVVLAVPFWLAVASLWKTEIGMLALDEPTANLDEDNRAFLAQALANLGSRVRDSRQIIMVTHAENLRTAFDQVIDLGVAS